MLLLSAAAVGTLLLAGAHSFAVGTVALILIGFWHGGGSGRHAVPAVVYFGLRSFSRPNRSDLDRVHTSAWRFGPVLMGRVYDVTGSYAALLMTLAGGTFVIALLMAFMPEYERSAVQTAVA